MPDPFEFSEIDEYDRIFRDYPILKIGNSPAFYLILRGIIGNIKIRQTFRGKQFSQVRNLLVPQELPYIAEMGEKITKQPIPEELKSGILGVLDILKTRCKSNLEVLPQYISDSFTLKDLSDVLLNKEVIHRNKNFFDSLNNEYCNYYYHTDRDSHTVAFLHLYRVLEYISYTFPVMYASSTKDFSQSFELLKTLFSGEKDKGELKVFKDFIKKIISNERAYRNLSIDIDIVSDLEEYNTRIYKTLLTICGAEVFDEA